MKVSEVDVEDDGIVRALRLRKSCSRVIRLLGKMRMRSIAGIYVGNGIGEGWRVDCTDEGTYLALLDWVGTF